MREQSAADFGRSLSDGWVGKCMETLAFFLQNIISFGAIAPGQLIKNNLHTAGQGFCL